MNKVFKTVMSTLLKRAGEGAWNAVKYTGAGVILFIVLFLAFLLLGLPMYFLLQEAIEKSTKEPTIFKIVACGIFTAICVYIPGASIAWIVKKIKEFRLYLKELIRNAKSSQ